MERGAWGEEQAVNNKARAETDQLFYHDINSTFPNNHVKRWTAEDYPSVPYTVLLYKNQPILGDDGVLLDALPNRRLDLDIYISLPSGRTVHRRMMDV